LFLFFGENLLNKIKKIVDELNEGAIGTSSKNTSILSYLKILRPHQWLKNILVFLPMFVSHQFSELILFQSILAFISFSLISSSAYVLNDLLDISADRMHPRKRFRQFASGEISVIHGFWLIPTLLILGLFLGYLVSFDLILLLLSYYLITIFYSIYLKQIAIVDICILAGLYTMRILAGSAATTISLSNLLLAFSIFIFFSLAAFKRQVELKDSISRGLMLTIGRGYHIDDLLLVSQMAIVSGYLSTFVLALYVDSIMAQELYQQPSLLWGVCLVFFYWVNRVAFVTHRGRMPDDPLVFAVKDRISQLCLLIGFLFVLGATFS
jgi:4-hydroxybenzoate polyprenyltransferase